MESNRCMKDRCFVPKLPKKVNKAKKISRKQEMGSKIKTFAFFDTETTGLPDLEYFKTKITELSIVAFSVDHFMDPRLKLPRVQHKLTMCFNPWKRIDLKASEITGLTNDLLEHEKKFDKNAMNVLESFLFHLQQPVCLIAHNGINFDFPLLKKQYDQLKGSFPFTIKCCDSLQIFKKIHEQTELKEKLLRESYSLQQWADVKEDGLLINAVIEAELKIEVQADSNGIDEDFQKLIKEELEDIEKTQKENLEDNKHSISNNEFKSWQKINETTPEATTKQLNLKPIARTETATKRTVSSRRELFPATSTANSERKPWKSFSLPEIYKRFFGAYPDNSHDAESDVIALMKCAAECKEDFAKLINETCFDFVDIKGF